MAKPSNAVLKAIGEAAIPITKRIKHVPHKIGSIELHESRTKSDYDKILEAIGPNTKVVMIGEASHGTMEFYRHRAEITKRLVTEMGFNIVAVEADWPDASRINEYISGNSKRDKNAKHALGDFKRFPRWMWRNVVVEEFVEWMKGYNSLKQKDDEKVGFYGLDVYSFSASRNAVLAYLNKVDPEAAKRAKKFYACFDHFEGDDIGSSYAWSTGLGLSASCQQEVERVLKELFVRGQELMEKDPREDRRAKLFYAQQNAKVVKDVEDYYRNMAKGSHITWNIRDGHMCNTLVDLMDFLNKNSSSNVESKAVIWAHNSHLGDSSQTEAGWDEPGPKKYRGKEYNLGQLVRKQIGKERTFNIGFSTYHGTVTAAYNWDEEPEFMTVNDGLPGSWEHLLHSFAESGNNIRDYMLIFRRNSSETTKNPQSIFAENLAQVLKEPRVERAIGVIYCRETERQSHYFGAKLPQQFDMVIHLDETEALMPLDLEDFQPGGPLDDTFPSGL
jgi:erythromycin esterase-like protein